MRLTIFAKVALMLVLSIIVVIAPLIYTVRTELQEYIGANLVERLELASNALEDRIEAGLDTVYTFLWQATRRVDIAAAVASGDISSIEPIIMDMEKNSGINFITLSDSTGTVIMRSHSPRREDSVANQGNVRNSLGGTPITVDIESGSEVTFSVRGGSPLWHEGKVVGVLTVGVRLDTLDFVDSIKKKYGTEVTLFKNDMRISTTLVDAGGQRMVGTKITNPIVLERVLKDGGSYTDENVVLAGKSYTAIYKPFTNKSGKAIGMIFLGMSNDSSEALLGSLMSGIIIVGVVVALVMGVLGVFISRAIITKPLARVSGIISDLVEDKAELSFRLDTSKGDELAALSHQVNRLTGKVENMLSNIAGYRNVVKSIPDPVFVVDKDFKLLLGNQTVQEVSGAADMESLYGKHINEVLHADICDVEGCAMRELMRTGEPVMSEVYTLPIDGKPRKFRGMCEVVRDHNGEIFGYLQVASDVTDIVAKEEALNAQMERIAAVNAQVTQIADNVNESASSIQEQTTSIQAAAENQSRVLSETLTSIQQMTDTVMDIAKNAANASSKADSGQQKATEGEAIMRQAMEALDSVQRTTGALQSSLGELGSVAEGIGAVMNVISDIADQTNLLALNAAIEAARAGDAGRGFAVVADEVRKLAEKTMGATQEVRTAVTNIQHGATSNISSMEEVSRAVNSAVELSRSSEEALSSIVDIVSETNASIASIATAAEEQSAASEQIAKSSDEVSHIAENTLQLTTESAHAVHELAALAEKLHRTVH